MAPSRRTARVIWSSRRASATGRRDKSLNHGHRARASRSELKRVSSDAFLSRFEPRRVRSQPQPRDWTLLRQCEGGREANQLGRGSPRRASVWAGAFIHLLNQNCRLSRPSPWIASSWSDVADIYSTMVWSPTRLAVSRSVPYAVSFSIRSTDTSGQIRCQHQLRSPRDHVIKKTRDQSNPTVHLRDT